MDNKKKKQKQNNINCGFYSETFSIQISHSQEQVKEAVLIEGNLVSGPSIFIVFFDKKFYHISLKSKQILSIGEIVAENSFQNFKSVILNNKQYIGFTTQYELHLLDLESKQLLQNNFRIKIPGSNNELNDEQKQSLMQDGFMYEAFNKLNIIATCEVMGVTNLPSDDKNVFYCCIYNFYENEKTYMFHMETKSKQVLFCKLNDSDTFAVFENHRQFSKQENVELVLHTYNVSKSKIYGYKKIKLPIKEDSCILSARYIDKEYSQIIIIGNGKCAPFLKVFSLSQDQEPKVQLLTDLILNRSFDQLISKVLLINEKYIFYETVQEGGVYFEFLEYNTRKIKYRKQIQYQKNKYLEDKEKQMTKDEFSQMQKYPNDQVYIQNVQCYSENILVLLDDQDFENYYGQLPYQLLINYHKYCSLQTLLLYLMKKKDLILDYSEYDIKNCIDMLLKDDNQ
ncbi:hypothetical protein TTHERM_00455640 (macronuclear) [Tetrahymena thermophila SB210]|uniref:Uncharacterized protein n=1 Tax=Tetrahymena thermophila (strain SB210) TaxID=312017 RepID=I7MA89_TETTS|nr:hypothetical protein TTHERM_00455640 [Tetrahymena thermophila SB210]EAS03925.2 hypothetical protein TTHERM_00455640 [Tetrahymena thermophila SB210]|eukprot:XP_001024170.2 hypothetical protein TTHERM_00455640 [Tetrahymena thermophila SB210]